MLKLPKFSSNSLVAVSVCLHVDHDGSGNLPLKDSLDWAVVDKGREIYACRIIDVMEDHWHFHVEVGFEYAVPIRGEEVALKEILTIPTAARSNPGMVTLWGVFGVDTKRLVGENFVRVLSSLGIKRGGYALNLSGATFDLTGDGPYRQLRWTNEGDSDILLHIAALEDGGKLDNNVLVKAADVATKGFAMFVKGELKRKSSRNTATLKSRGPRG